MSARRHIFALSACSLLLQGALSVLPAAASEATQALLKQARYWQDQDNVERAREAWGRLLAVDPQHPQPLYWLGLQAARDQAFDQARGYLQQLNQLPAAKTTALQLEQDIYLLEQGRPQQLEQARILAESGELEEALAAYRSLLDGRQPQGELGFEFYNYLGYTQGGWAEARQGLERLNREQPVRGDWSLALAKLLTRNEATRLDGLRRLAELAEHQQVGSEALETWREVLTWLGRPRPEALPLFQRYLQKVPGDQEIRRQMDSAPAASNAGPARAPLAGAFKALDAGDLEKAERLFADRLKRHPNDADALGGLGIIRQKQNRLDEAEPLLGKAVRQSGGQQWRKAYDEVRYWSLLRQADEQRSLGLLHEARTRLDQALAFKPQATEALLVKAGLLAEQGDYENSEKLYRQVLARTPEDVQARRGLIGVLAPLGKHDEALTLAKSLPQQDLEQLGGMGQLRAEHALQRARIAGQRGDVVGQRTALEEALRNDPTNVWVRFELARLYVHLGAVTEARSLMEGLLAARPGDRDVLYTNALLSVQLGDWEKAGTLLGRMPQAERDAQVNRLVAEVDFNLQLKRIEELSRSGQKAEARVFLHRIEDKAQGSPSRQSALASAYAGAGDPQQAMTIMRDLLARSPHEDLALTIAYAGVLLQAEQDTEVAGILRDLQGRTLSVDERRQYHDLLFLYRVRQAEQLRERGELAAAYDTLAPALAQRPQDPLAVAALSRMYEANGDVAKALELLKPLIERNPGNASLHVGFAGLAARVNDRGLAEASLDKALKLAPQDAEILSSAAQVYRAMGRTGTAAELLRKVVAQEQRQQTPSFARAAPQAGGNPFAGIGSGAIGEAGIPVPAQVLPSRADYAAVAPIGAFGSNLAIPPAYGAPSSRPQYSGEEMPHANNPFLVDAQQASANRVNGLSKAAQALDKIEQERSGYVVQGFSVRVNDSEPGLSKLADIQAPVEINLPVHDDRVAVRVTPVHLNAGNVGSESKTRFGSGALGGNGSAGRQQDTGLGLAVAWESERNGVKADIGISPMGFLYSTEVGGISLNRPMNDSGSLRYDLSLSRRAVTDSVTSFAGTRDARTNLEWGGVTATGGRAQLGFDNGRVGAYGYGSLHELNGHDVSSNTRFELGSGVYWYLLRDDNHLLTTGVSLTSIHYRNNQNHFTYGSGGYFSPQNFYSLAFPLGWARRGERWSYALSGAVGVQHIKQDSVDYFPADGDLQAALLSASADGRNLDTSFDGSSDIGIGYNLHGTAEFQLGRHMFLGGELGLNNAQDYRQLSGGLYLRYKFKDQSRQLMDLPVIPFQSPYYNQR